ncbi:MAG: hypothetical protein COA42_06175 [Alteromonadaceae bacterium]|nr:MAG: hypothetical protein COA42_06175 [Alteromonadaceae bacterium]
MKRIFTILSAVALLVGMSACVTTGKTPAQKRESVQTMRTDALTELFKMKPDVRAQIKSAAGYAVFSNANINLIFASFGAGYGVAKNNTTGKYTYMNMGEVGLGIGAGVKDFRIVFVFHTADSLSRFINKGWAFGVQADAAAKGGKKGVAVGGEATVDNTSIYQMTVTGLALQATVKGTKFWRNTDLN